MHDVAWLSLTNGDVPAGDAWLSAAERAVQARLGLPKRRQDWRLGRYAAKHALAAWLAAPGNTPGAPLAAAAAGQRGTSSPPAAPLRLDHASLADLARLEVLAAADGAPEAWRDGRRLAVSLSISHSHGRGLVALAPPGVAIGCDVERSEPRSAAFVEDYFSADEQDFVRGRPAGEQPLWATLIWSGKESALKALRQGLRLPTQTVTVRLPKPSAALRAAGASGAGPADWHGYQVEGGAAVSCVTLEGAWRAEDGWVFTLARGGPRCSR